MVVIVIWLVFFMKIVMCVLLFCVLISLCLIVKGLILVRMLL